MLILLVLLAMLQAPAELTVTVRSATGPVAGARVELGTAQGTTDDPGRLTLTGVAPGTLTVQADGFLPASVVLADPLPPSVDVTLDPVPDLDEEVVAEATGTATRLADQPLRVEVVDAEEIEEKALMTPGSVAMPLAETTGLRVQTTAPSLGAANVRVNGLRGRYTQLLADGLPLYGSQGDSLSLLQVPPLDLGRIEIIKGAASALYGPTALGGVVNLVARRPAGDDVDDAGQRHVAGGCRRDRLFARRPRGGWGWTLLGGYHAQQPHDLDDDGWSDVPEYDRGVVRPRLFYDNGRGGTVFATVGASAENRQGGTLWDTVAPDGQPFVEAARHASRGQRRRGSMGHRRWTSSGAARIDRTDGSASGFGDAREHGRRLVWFGEASLAGVVGRHSWVLARPCRRTATGTTSSADVDFTFTAPGVFAQDDVRINDSLSGRSRRGSTCTASTECWPTRACRCWRGHRTAWTMRVSTGLGTFAPTPFTEETEEVGFSRLRFRDDLVAERAWAASADVTRVLRLVRADGDRALRPASAIPSWRST